MTHDELLGYAYAMVGAPLVPEKPYNPLESVDEQLAELDRVHAQVGGLGYSTKEAAQHLLAVAPDCDPAALISEARDLWK
jgi:hypothetical protein